jgi:hypothetical protein
VTGPQHGRWPQVREGRTTNPLRDITPDDVRAWTLWTVDPFRDEADPPVVQLWRDHISGMSNGDERAMLVHDYHERVTEVLLRYLRATVTEDRASPGG